MLKELKLLNRIRPIAKVGDYDEAAIKRLISKVRYGGNHLHKKNPGDFGLQPPSRARAGKALCDTAQVFTLREAMEILRSGIKSRLFSPQMREGWPQNIWPVASREAETFVFEAQIENSATGTYHGYSLPLNSQMGQAVLLEWRKRNA